VVQDDAEAETGVDEHDGVGDDEDPVADQPAVDEEAERGGELADEEPLRDVLARPLLPLLVNLLADGQHEYQRAGPPDGLLHP
jgi:hypothetical protein